MDLELSEEQKMLRDMLRGVLDEHCGIEVVRQMEDDPEGVPTGLWKQLSELGVLGLLLPEAHGGGGQGLLEAALLYEELGRALAPVPHFESAVLCAGLLRDAGSEAQRRAWLPRIASGEAVLTPAWLEPEGGFGPRGVALRAAASGGDFVLSGRKRHVTFAGAAERLVVLARTGEGERDVDLFLVDPRAEGVSLLQQRSLASDSQYQVDFAGVRVAADARIGAPGTGWASFDAVLHEGLVLLAAQAIGGAQKAHEITTEYAGQRKQFDKPIGAFQAISHYLADAVTHIEGGRVLVHQAAWNRDQGRSIARLAPMAKLFACQTFRDTTAMCEQVWGGVGFTIEYDIQLYFRRAKQLQLSWWDSHYLEELIAADALDDSDPEADS